MIDDELLEPTVNYCWVDEDGNRVSPKHAELGIAISWYSRRPAALARIEAGERRLEERGENAPRFLYEREKIDQARQKHTLTGKEPVDLKRIVLRRSVEEISEAERAVVNQIQGESNAR